MPDLLVDRQIRHFVSGRLHPDHESAGPIKNPSRFLEATKKMQDPKTMLRDSKVLR